MVKNAIRVVIIIGALSAAAYIHFVIPHSATLPSDTPPGTASTDSKSQSIGKSLENTDVSPEHRLEELLHEGIEWPPVTGRRFPDLIFRDQSGKYVPLSSLRGKVIFVEPVAVTSASSLAFAGGHDTGPFEGLIPQQGLPSMSVLLAKFAKGLKLSDDRIARVQIMFLNREMNAPNADDIQGWVRHFKVDRATNHLVMSGVASVLPGTQHSYVPGVWIVDKSFNCRFESVGLPPRHDLYKTTLPAIPSLLYEPGPLGVADAYEKAGLRRSAFDPDLAKMPIEEKAFLLRLFALTDQVVGERVTLSSALTTGGMAGHYTLNFAANIDHIIEQLKSTRATEKLEPVKDHIATALVIQKTYFMDWLHAFNDGRPFTFVTPQTVIGHSAARRSSRLLSGAADLLKNLYAGEDEPIRTSITNHLAALDVCGLQALPTEVATAAPERRTSADDAPMMDALRQSQSEQSPARGAIYLSSSSPRSVPKESHRGLLLREIARQAVLIAARDELGVPTSDASLRQPEPPNASASMDIRTTAIPTQGGYVLDIEQRGNGAEVFRHDIEIDSTDKVEYLLRLVTKVELLSRTEFAGWLRKIEVSGNVPEKSDVRLPFELEKSLKNMSFTAQFGAIRDMHDLIRLNGESTALIGGLVRGYANLGQLTSVYWNTSHKVFKARALLYAERLVAAAPQSPMALWHRAYARALAGLQGPALADIETADAITKETPPWVEMIRLYCRYDAEGLKTFGEANWIWEQPARYLRLMSLEHSRMYGTKYRAAWDVFRLSPECYRAMASLCEVGGVSSLRQATRKMSYVRKTTLFGRLWERKDLPRQIGDHFARRQGGREASYYGTLVEMLMSDQVQSTDRGEPGWSALGALIQENAFLFGYHDMHLRRDIWSVQLKDQLSDLKLAANGHPLLKFLESFNVDRRAQWPDYVNLLNQVIVTDPDVQTTPMLNAIKTAQRSGPVPSVYMDSISGDLEQGLYKMRLPVQSRIALVKLLKSASPHSPAIYTTLITDDWASSAPQLAEWDRDYGHHADVAMALARRYLATGRTEDAKAKLIQLVEVSTDQWPFISLAQIYKSTGDLDSWKEVLDKYIEKGDDTGLEKTTVRVQIARHFMNKGEFEKAEPYMAIAAKSWAGWAMMDAAECYAGLDRWQDAELWVSRTSNRYEESQMDWFFWCMRHGRGDTVSAQKLAEKMAQRLKAGGATYFTYRIAAYCVLSEQFDEAIRIYERLYAGGDSYAAMFAALVAEQTGDRVARESALQRARSSEPQSAPIARLAALESKVVRGRPPAELPAAELAGLAREAGTRDGPWMNYLIGKLLDLRGYSEQAQDFYVESARSGSQSDALAALANRGIKLPAGPIQDLKVVDFISRQPIAPEELASTRDYGLRIIRVTKDGPAAKGGLKTGDLILCADGLRFFGGGEYSLVRLMDTTKNHIDLIVSRRGRIVELRLNDLQGDRIARFEHDYSLRVSDTLRACGINLSRTDELALEAFPPRGADLIAHWFTSGRAQGQDLDWLKQHIALYLSLVNQEFGNAAPPEAAAPIPFVNQLNGFYRSIAERNRDGEQPPDWEAHNVSLDFYLLYYPFPRLVPPAPGPLEFTDKELLRYLRLKTKDARAVHADTEVVAQRYVDRRDANVYMNVVKASILAPATHGGWPHRESRVRNAESRRKIVSAMSASFQKGGPDAVLYAYALVAPMVIDRNYSKLAEYVRFINSKSPYLVIRAAYLARNTAYSWKMNDAVATINSKLSFLDLQTTPKKSAFLDRIKDAESLKNIFPFAPIAPDGDYELSGPGVFLRGHTAPLKKALLETK